MTNGAKQVSGGATVVGERFEAPRPAYQAPQNADYMNVQEKDNTPAKPLVQQVKDNGNDKLAALIAKAQENAKAAAARAEAKRAGQPAAPKKRASKSDAPTNTVVVGHFTPEDVCKDDREFIVRTRSSDIHSEEMKRLFWANGGEKYVRAGLGYAAAFSNLRQEKSKALNQKR